MKEQFSKLVELGRENIGYRMRIEPESSRASKNQLLGPMDIERSDFRRQHPAHRMTDDMGALDFQLVHQLVIEQRRIDYVIDMLGPGRCAKSGQMGRDYVKVLGEVLEKRLEARESYSTVEEEQRVAAPVFLHFHREFAAVES